MGWDGFGESVVGRVSVSVDYEEVRCGYAWVRRMVAFGHCIGSVRGRGEGGGEGSWSIN